MKTRRPNMPVFNSRGLVGRMLFAALLLGLSAVGCVDSPIASPGSGAAPQPLVIYCAASNKSVLEAIRADYEKEYDVPLQIQYGASQTLLASLEIAKTGDLYLPADDSYLTIARDKQLLTEEFAVAAMQAVVAVPKGNPKKIASLDDLLKDDVRLCQANPDAAAIGKLTRDVLTKAEKWEAVNAATDVFKTTVNEVAADVKVGAVDAGFVFDAVLHDFATLEAVKLPELADAKANVGIAILKSSEQPKQALHFARYLTASDKGLVRYRELGFEPVESDPWTEKPEIVLYAGSMLRPAIERTITDFEEREGVRVTRVYNGCGILVAQMKAGQVPDAYFACDLEFMKQVSDIFPKSEEISRNELVIMVKKGNPLNIRSLGDLRRPGLRVGIGHEKQCAMGWITQRTFSESGMQSELMKNVAVQTPTGDMLVNQMQTGSLDAAVAYLSNAAGAADTLDAIRITGLECSVATQPYAVAKNSTNKRLAERLLAAIRAETSHERFLSEGFRWVEEK
jgi:molybdenum ABC transporter molybdate-binding protein